MSSRWTLADLARKSAAIQKQVYPDAQAAETARNMAAQHEALKEKPGSLSQSLAKLTPGSSKPTKNRIRQNASGLNKTEQAFLDLLKGDWPTTPILSQAITLKIGNGVRYTPDFMLADPQHAGFEQENPVQIWAWEVKGFMRDDAAVKLKVAASLYPWIKFHLVTRKKGEWQIQEILP